MPECVLCLTIKGPFVRLVGAVCERCRAPARWIRPYAGSPVKARLPVTICFECARRRIGCGACGDGDNLLELEPVEVAARV